MCAATGLSIDEALREVAFTTATPFTPDGTAVDYEALERNLAYLEEHGATVFIPCGNTGEYYALSRGERTEVVATSVAATDADATVIGGAGGSVPTVLDLAGAYDRAGADGLLLMDVDHTYVHQQGVADYYEAIAAESPLPMVLYKRSAAITLDCVERLAALDAVVGIKFAVNDVAALAETVATVPDDFVVANGIAERFAPAFALEGAPGFTTGIGGFVPEASLALHRAIGRADWDRARRLRDLLHPIEALRQEAGVGNDLRAANNVPVVKYGMELAGLSGGPVRPPLVDLAPADKRRLEGHYDRIAEAELGQTAS